MHILSFQFNQSELSVDPIWGNDAEFSQLLAWHRDTRINEFYYDDTVSNHKIITIYQAMIAEPAVTPCMISIDNKPIGYVVFFEMQTQGEWGVDRYEIEYEPNLYAIDLFIGETEYWGQGIASKVLQHLTKYLVNQLRANNVFLDPRIDNHRAIQAFKKAGFKRIKRIHEKIDDNNKPDTAYLMALYA